MTTGLHERDGDPARGPGRPWTTSRLLATLAVWLSGWSTGVAGVLAHSGHAHPDGGGGGGLLLPGALLLGGVAVLGTSVYLDRTGEIEGWMARSGVLLGVVGLLAGSLLTLF